MCWVGVHAIAVLDLQFWMYLSHFLATKAHASLRVYAQIPRSLCCLDISSMGVDEDSGHNLDLHVPVYMYPGWIRQYGRLLEDFIRPQD